MAGRLLIVEDDPRIASFMAKGLSRQGFECIWSATGEQALAHLTRSDSAAVDLFTLDLGLPDLPGIGSAAARPGSRRGGPGLVVTAYRDGEGRAEAAGLGIASYLVKPVPLAVLVEHIHALGVAA